MQALPENRKVGYHVSIVCQQSEFEATVLTMLIKNTRIIESTLLIRYLSSIPISPFEMLKMPSESNLDILQEHDPQQHMLLNKSYLTWDLGSNDYILIWWLR